MTRWRSLLRQDFISQLWLMWQTLRPSPMRVLGIVAPQNRKAPFLWGQIVMFGMAYGVLQQGYCHLVVATMTVLMFGGMCRYSDVSLLQWRHFTFDTGGRFVEITFDRRKNSQFRQGNTVTVAAAPQGDVCPIRLLRALQVMVGTDPASVVFRGFNGRLVAKNPGRTTPFASRITYGQYHRYLSQWFGGVLGLTPVEFRAQFGTQSGRSGGASAASNAGIALELWGQHRAWASFASQKCYMARDEASILSVSRAAMGLVPSIVAAPSTPPGVDLDVRVEGNDVIVEAIGDADVVAEVEGVPEGTFAWSERLD